MLEYNSQYETHKLYNHFKSWIDMEENYQDSYFIINTALYAAEDYIYNTYNLATKATKIHEYFGDVTEDELFPKFNIHNLLAVYTDDGYTLPSTIHYDDISKTYITEDGPFRMNGGVLNEVNAINMNLEYITGYVYPENARDTSVIPEGSSELYGEEVTRPAISNSDSSPLYSPLSTTNSYYDLHIIGDTSSTIYVDGVIAELRDATGILITEEVNPQPTINDDRIGKITLSLATGINTFVIDARDASDNVSEEITIIINKQTKFMDTSVELQGKDLATNDGNYKLIVSSTPGSSISVNGTEELAYSNGTDVVEATLATEGTQDISIVVTSPAGTISRPLLTHVLYDTNLTDDYLESLNDLGFNSMIMPQDMLMAILMIANHYFRIALYKHEDTVSYGDNISNRTTFESDRFPKEAHRILSQYVIY